ncbi:MAG: efflux transporter outer membrane subunit [Nitrosomonas sp.]|jgi:NodT family efflux transporter outer membrane factor (OMF) lipoprotein|nr:efflux transporter outer membrane subunit [Nitrosomonas sp.]
MSGIFKVLMLLYLLATVSGCSNMPERQPAELLPELPQEWRATPETHAFSDQHWVESFGDPVLSRLVERALTYNYNLKSAAARVDAAVAQARIDGSGLWPQLSFAPGYQYTQIRSAGFGSAQFSVFEAMFNLSWELDVWGRVRAARTASLLDADASGADYDAARLSLAARVAQNYFALLEARLQTQVAEQSVTDRSNIARVTQGRFEQGLVRGLDVRLALTDLSNAKSQLAQAKNQVQQITRQLEVLLGQYPADDWSKTAEAIPGLSGSPDFPVHQQTLPDPPGLLPAGLPSDLLARRPDLVAAFSRLLAADARLDSARKLMLPRITLTGAGGTRDTALVDLVDPRSAVWNLFAGIMHPLFTGGRIRGGIQLNEARVEEALTRYQDVALNAFREVEQALAAEEWLREQEKALREAVEQTEASHELALYYYRLGFIQILTLLDSYRSNLSAQSAHLSVQRQLLHNRINLYLALGGGI